MHTTTNTTKLMTHLQLLEACQNGDLTVAQNIHSQIKNFDIHWFRDHISYTACDLGHIYIMKWLKTLSPDNFPHNHTEHACLKNNFEMLKWLMSVQHPTPECALRCLTAACAVNNTTIMTWLFDNYSDLMFTDYRWRFDALHRIYHGHSINTDTLTWLYMRGFPFEAERSIISYSMGNHLELVKWSYYAFPITKHTLNTCVMYSCEHVDNLDCLVWLTNKGAEITEECFVNSCSGDNIEAVKWVMDHCDVTNISTKNKKRLFTIIFIKSNIKIIKLVHSLFTIDDDALDYGYTKCCEQYGSQHVLRWICSVKKPSQKTIDDGFNNACERGQLELCKFLYEQGITCDLTQALTRTCTYGKVNCAKWLYSVNKCDDDVLIDIFVNTQSETLVAKWIYDLGIIDKTTINECFTYRCNSDSMYQWLHSTGHVNIHYDCDYAIKNMCDSYSCGNQNDCIIEWLYLLGNFNIYTIKKMIEICTKNKHKKVLKMLGVKV